MKAIGYIVKVTEPIEWVSSMVVSVQVRICIDPSDLNKVIKRKHHPLRTTEEVISTTLDAKVSWRRKADSSKSTLMKPLHCSQLSIRHSAGTSSFNLKIFVWNQVRPEIFQRIMNQMLEEIERATAFIYDILIAGSNTEHHDAVPQRSSKEQRATT